VGVGGQVLHVRGLVVVLGRGAVLFLFAGKGPQVEGLAGGVGDFHGEHGGDW
jgi:hypothetical protein